MVRRSRARAATTRSATGTGGGRRAPAWSRRAGRRADQLELVLLRLGVGARRGDGRVLPAPVLAQAARPQLGEPGGPRGGLRDDALVARPRGRRLPHGRHQLHLQGPGAARRPVAPAGAFGDGTPYYVCGPRIHEFLRRDAPRGVRRARRRCSPSARCRASPSRRRGCSPTRPARELDMVFQFEHVRLDQGDDQVGRAAAARCATSRRRSGAGRPGSPTSAGTASTGTTTTSRGSSRASATTASTACASAKMLATVLHLHRGTPYVYQGEELGMTNAPFAAHRGLPRHRVAQPLRRRRSRGGADPERRARRAARAMGRDNARTPMQWDASPHAGFTTGTPWLPVNPNHVEINAAAAARRPGLGLPPLPAADRAAPRRAGGRARRLHDAAAATTSACTRSRGGSATSSCWCSATSPASRREPCPTPAAGPPPRCWSARRRRTALRSRRGRAAAQARPR